MQRIPLHRRGRPAARDQRSRNRRSVIHYLVALTIVPSIGLPVLAGLFTQDRFEDARAAERIGDKMALVVELHDLRTVVFGELSASGIQSIAVRYGFTLDELGDLLGEPLVPVATARGETDAFLASFRPDDETRPAIEKLATDLDDVRTIADRSAVPSDGALDAGWDMHLGYRGLDRTLSKLKQDTIRRVVTGDYGAGSKPLLTAVAQVERVTMTVDVGNEQGVALGALFVANTDEDRALALTELGAAATLWRRLSSELPQYLSDDVRRSWDGLTGSVDIAALDKQIDQLAPAAGSTELPTDVSGAQEATDAVTLLTKGLSFLVHDSASEGVAIAKADEVTAARRAQLAVIGTGLLLIVTTALLVMIGGLLRRRLGSLAVAAERFSAGTFDEMPVNGPREIAVASAALNDAVASFRQVSVQAEKLSTGDLDAPELRHPAPGALGAAVHASVQQIVAAVRERERLRAELVHQAAHDDLTHLPNRAETERLLEHALARAQRSGGRVAVLFVDLDRFKECNDSLGHAAGDQVLRTAADRMTAVVRPGDTVCRLGGDEFVVVIEPVGTTGSVVEIAERIAASLAEPMTYGDDIIVTGGSVGIAISDGRSNADSLLREADSAMYLAKATARGGVEIFNDALRAGLQAEAEFRTAMAEALVNGELELHYQPVLDVADGRPTAFEALARWHRPGFGLIPPDQFIPMAEKSGLIIEIGQWALHTATAQLVSWSGDPAYASVKVAVNLSGRHVAQAGVVDDVRAALAASGLAPERLIVEITESIAIDSAATIDHLIDLSELGVLIALDDFGTGYTSIGQLLHLPVHILKIDRSLISGTNEDGTPALEQTSRIVELIIEVAHSLGFEVVAEGVEDVSQLTALGAVTCDSAQGYLFSRPLPADQIEAWVAAHEHEVGVTP